MPRRSVSGGSARTALIAPRALNEPVTCSASSLSSKPWASSGCSFTGAAASSGDRHRKARAQQQRRDIGKVGGRRYARARPALLDQLGFEQRGAQLGEGAAAQHRREKQPVGSQNPAQLDERPGQITDPVQG